MSNRRRTTGWVMLAFACGLRKLHKKNFKIVESHNLGGEFIFCEISNEACAVIRSETFWKPQIVDHKLSNSGQKGWWSIVLAILAFIGSKVVTAFRYCGLCLVRIVEEQIYVSSAESSTIQRKLILFHLIRILYAHVSTTITYIHNWSLQSFSQDYWPSFSHHLCCVC